MKSLNLYSLFSLLIFCALSLSSGIAQKGDTIFQLTQRSEESFYADYKDYTGRTYSANELSYLQEQSSQLDGSGHEGFLIAPYNLITSFTGINDALFDVAVSGMSAEKYLLVYVYYVDSQGLTPDFRVKIKNPDLNQEDIPGMEYYLAGVMKAYGEEAISVPDQLGKGIETYLDMIDSEAVVRINYSALGAGGSDEVRPHFELTDNSNNATYTFVTPAGIPIVIPSGAFVRFYKETEDNPGALHSFMFPNEEGAKYYMPLTYAISSDTEVYGKFAGYGYRDENEPRGFKFYSYAPHVQDNVCGKPDYEIDEVVDLFYGYTQGCAEGQKKGEANLRPRLYEVAWEDETDPEAYYSGVPAYRGAGKYRDNDDLESQAIDELQAICGDEVVTLQSNVLQKLIPFPCWVKKEIGESIRRANLSNPDDYLFISFEDGQEGVLAIKGNDIYLSYVNNSGEIELLKHDQFYGWMYADFEEATFSGDISKILEWAGDLAVAAGITGTFIAVNAALAGALTPAAAAYGVEAGAILLVDMTVAGAEAGVVYAVTGDSDQAVATFVGGTVGAVGGTILSQAFKGYRAIGYSDDLDAMLKVYRPGTQGQASDLMTVSLKSAKDQMEQAGLDAQAIDQVFREMEKSDKLGRFILEDPTRAKALKYASDAYPDREWCTDGCTFLRALDDQLKSAGPDLEYFFKNNPDGVRAWELTRQFADPTDVSLLTRLANDMADKPNLALIITNHVDPNGAYNIWNKVSLGERFIAETKFYNVMDELVPLAFPHNCSSGIKVYANAPDDTFLIGNFADDGEAIMNHFDYPEIVDEMELLNTITEGFPLPAGQQFNMLNVSMDLYDIVKYNTSGNWPGAGGFFTKVNGPWVASAADRGRIVLVISDRDLYRFRPNGELSAFGKEMRDLENALNYSFDPSDLSYKPN